MRPRASRPPHGTDPPVVVSVSFSCRVVSYSIFVCDSTTSVGAVPTPELTHTCPGLGDPPNWSWPHVNPTQGVASTVGAARVSCACDSESQRRRSVRSRVAMCELSEPVAIASAAVRHDQRVAGLGIATSTFRERPQTIRSSAHSDILTRWSRGAGSSNNAWTVWRMSSGFR